MKFSTLEKNLSLQHQNPRHDRGLSKSPGTFYQWLYGGWAAPLLYGPRSGFLALGTVNSKLVFKRLPWKRFKHLFSCKTVRSSGRVSLLSVSGTGQGGGGGVWGHPCGGAVGVWELCLPELGKKLQCGPVRGPGTWEASEPPGRVNPAGYRRGLLSTSLFSLFPPRHLSHLIKCIRISASD